MNNVAVKTNTVCKGFGEGETRTEVLKEVNFEARMGELLMLVGPSGCGKTTLLSVIAGTLGVDRGEVEVFDSPLHSLDKRAVTQFRAANIGFIFLRSKPFTRPSATLSPSDGERGRGVRKSSWANPYDRVAATRLISMMSGCNFVLPAAAPLRHGAAVNTLSLSAEGRRVLTAADDGKARVWDLQGGRVLTTLTHPLKVTEAAFLADERFVLT